MKLSSFDYVDASYMLFNYNNEDIIKFYSCIGGTPYYLSRIDKQLNFEKNIHSLFFVPSGYLYEEPLLLLKQELREGAMYNSIINAVALGYVKLNEIASKIGEEPSKIIKYIDTLITLDILYREFPYGENPVKSRKGIYRIKDNCYRFWYRYVFTNKTIIEQGAGAALLKSFLPELNSFIGIPFEDICLQYMIRKNNLGDLPFVFTQFGRWWGSNTEIDIVFSNMNEKKFVFAECKWRNDLKDTNALKKLIENSRSFQLENKKRFDISSVYYYLFSKKPFSKSCEELAKQMGNVSLISIRELFDHNTKTRGLP